MRLLPKEQDWTPYGYLVYFVYFLAGPFLFSATSRGRVMTVAATLAGVTLYFAAYWVQDRRILWLIGGQVALGVLLIPSNPAASVFFVYGASFLGKAFEPAEAYRYLAGIVAIAGLEAGILRLAPYAWIPAVLFPVLIGALIIQQQQRERLTKRLLMAQEEAQRLAKVAERERIGRDLHDLLGHTLSVIILKSELASKLAEIDPARAAQEIREVERISRESLAQVRAAVQGYRSGGIESEVAHARSALDAAGVRLDASMGEHRLPAALETVLAMALREAVTNIVRHARATMCRLSLRQDGTWCELEVADNGRGGDLPEGNGLSGMRQRVEALGGALERDGSAGTRLRIRVPV
jgi:two-component system, NarL family, sensor histidine kinase DesK